MVSLPKESDMWKALIGKYLGVILAAATLGLTTGATTHLFAFWALESEFEKFKTAEELEEGESKKRQEDTLAKLDVLIGQIGKVMEQQEEFKGLILTPAVTGRGTIGDFGFESSFVDINEYGNAKMYLGSDEVMVHVADQDGISHQVTVKVRGSFRNRPDPGHLVMFSAMAADELGVSGVVDRVTVGPAK